MEPIRSIYLFGRYGPGYAVATFAGLYVLSELVSVEFGLLSLLATVAGVLLLVWTFDSLDDIETADDFDGVAPTVTPGVTSTVSGVTGSISDVGSTSPVRDGGRHLQTRQKLGLFAGGLVVVGIVVLAEFTTF